jgi:hypothetical protein
MACLIISQIAVGLLQIFFNTVSGHKVRVARENWVCDIASRTSPKCVANADNDIRTADGPIRTRRQREEFEEVDAPPVVSLQAAIERIRADFY